MPVSLRRPRVLPGVACYRGAVGWLLLPGYKWLEVVPGRRGGRPTVRGTRITLAAG